VKVVKLNESILVTMKGVYKNDKKKKKQRKHLSKKKK